MRLIGGQLDIDSAGQGTTVRAAIPLPMETNKLEKIRILIADDHGLVRRGAGSVLRPARLESRRRGSKAANDRKAVEKAIKLKPDDAILDVGMPELDGLEATRQILEAVPDTKVLVLTMHESDQMVRRALEAGARGYLLKSDLTECLVKAVKDIAAGKRFLTPKVSEIVLDGFLRAKSGHQQRERPGARTTPRETEIIRLLAEGKMN